MKSFTYILLFFLASFSISAFSQSNSTVSFEVSGACGQCKDRIEKAANLPGVFTATWDEGSHHLTIVYDASKADLEKIKKNIVKAGHDIGDLKAKTSVYNALPACCHYREMVAAPAPGIAGDRIIKGVVIEDDKKGNFKALPFASVVWLGSNRGSYSDSSGVFTVRQPEGHDRLIVSYTGYRSDTITIGRENELRIVMATEKQLKEVIVSARRRATYISNLSAFRTQVITQKELFKAACCNLSESFETNPSVDVSYNDAVTGSKQIQLLGLSGNYTQLTIENLPGPRGLATPMGLNTVAGPWIESIQLTKGIGSVANGYESIAGQINVELKKPESSERLNANMYINGIGKTDLNLNLAQKLGKKWSTLLLLHDDFLGKKALDENKDGFRDLPYGNDIALINRWKYDDGKGFLMQLGIKAMNENRTGGESLFDPATEKHTTSHYGLGLTTDRYEAFGKFGYVFPQKKYKSIGLMMSAIQHHQSAYFGMNDYNGRQNSFYANLIYQSIIGSTKNQFRTGLSFLYDKYRETLNAAQYDRKQHIPGVFMEYTYIPSPKFNMVLGLRADNDNLYGAFVTPRIHLKYEIIKGTTLRFSAGRGQRTANIFAENLGLLASSREMHIHDNGSGKGYGLSPEIAWNKGVTIDQKLKLFEKEANFSLEFFRNDFQNQVVIDLETPGHVHMYNLMGKSWSNSFQAEISVEPIEKLELRMAYRYFDVKTTISDKLVERPLIAAHRGFATAEYATGPYKFEYTINLIGNKRIPPTMTNPEEMQMEAWSPSYVMMGGQISRTFGKTKAFEFYAGCENLGNKMQEKLILSADHPFSPYFDASIVWGPVEGRLFYAGWRLKIK